MFSAHGGKTSALFALDPAELPDDVNALSSSSEEPALQEFGKMKDETTVAFPVVVLDANLHENSFLENYMLPKLDQLGVDLVATFWDPLDQAV